MTHRRTWQKAEQRAASLFGTTRQPGSGSQGDPSRSTSDSWHEAIYLETKYRSKCAVRSLFDVVDLKAELEGKTPCLALFEKGATDFLIVCKASDAAKVLAELRSPRDE